MGKEIEGLLKALGNTRRLNTNLVMKLVKVDDDFEILKMKYRKSRDDLKKAKGDFLDCKDNENFYHCQAKVLRDENHRIRNRNIRLVNFAQKYKLRSKNIVENIFMTMIEKCFWRK